MLQVHHTVEEIDTHLTTLSNILIHCKTVDRKKAVKEVDKWLDLRIKAVKIKDGT